MSGPLIGAIGILILLILIFLRFWIGFAMLVIGFFGYAYIAGFQPALKILALVPYSTLAEYSFSVMPMFLFMGILTAKTGMGEDLYRTAYTWVGGFRGGLAIATTLACAIFAAINSTSMAAVVALGPLAVPEMKKLHYQESLATGCIAGGATLGILIPPSMGFIFYAVLTEQSVGHLFMAGILPGILMVTLFIGCILIITRVNPLAGPAGQQTSFHEKLFSLKYGLGTLLVLLLILVGIYSGIFTPTEAGGVGAFGTILVAAARRRLTIQIIIASLRETIQTMGMISLIIVGSYIVMRFMTITDLPSTLVQIISVLSLPRGMVLLIIIGLYIILGMFFDVIAAIAITIPILYPVVLALGFDPIWFGVLLVMLIEMGLITPPIGLNVYILSGISEISPNIIFKGIWPFAGAMLTCIILHVIFPKISLLLPSMMGF
jgi:tripartite ATP-independent transporter DctM subunit